MKSKSPRPILLKNYRPPDYYVDKVDLDVALDARETRVRSKLRLRPNRETGDRSAPLILDGENLTLERVKLSGRNLAPDAYEVSRSGLVIHDVPERPFTLEITTTCNPAANTALSGLYRSRAIYCTQCEAEGFRRITYFPDRPDVLSVYRARIEADRDDAPVLLSNGNCIETGKIARSRRHFALWHDPFPKPSYLFALVGGHLAAITDSFETMRGRKVALAIYVEPGKQDRCRWAMECLKRAMRWDEERFGREYDLDTFMIVAVSDFNMGAMENKGLNVFNDKLVLATPATATDENYAAIESVIAHEYFHNWTGNRITCRDWFQLCLKEGLTVYRDQEFSADTRERTVQRIDNVRQLRAHQFAEDAGPLAHPVRPEKYIEINNFYTPTIYQKGAELCRMIATLAGRDGFRAGMDLYFERHDGEAATVEQFIACFERACNLDLGHFMTWYRQAGTPELVCEMSYDAAAKMVELSIEQVLPPTPGQKRKRPLFIPLRLGLIGPDGHDIELKPAGGGKVVNGVAQLEKRRQVFRFEGVSAKPVPSLLRGFSAPVNISVSLSDRDLEFLMIHDSDAYNRWQAGQTYATRLATRIVEATRGGRKVRPGLSFARALGTSLADNRLDPAYRARLITLPSETDVARRIATDVDPEAIYLALRQLKRLVAGTLKDQLIEVYQSQCSDRPYSPDAGSVAKRSLGAATLALLAASGEKAEIARIARHYENAGNMTDRTVALGLLCQIDTPERLAALDDFFESARGDHVVIDKWFTFHATSRLPSALESVRELTRHELFSIKNPNNVRALIGAFAMWNQLNFHRPDGAGYRFVADRVLEIDRFNPQVAARLLAAFKSWKVLEANRQRRAKAELRRIARRKALSRDVFEIVTKMLD